MSDPTIDARLIVQPRARDEFFSRSQVAGLQNLRSELPHGNFTPTNRSIYPLVPDEFPFRYLDLSTIEDSFSPEYNTYSVLGRQNAFLEFTGVSQRVIKFNALMFDTDYAGYALDAARLLQALCLPWKDEPTPGNKVVHPPPRLTLQIFPESFINVVGVLGKVQITKMAPLVALDDGTLITGQVPVTIEFIVAEDLGDYDAFRFLTLPNP